MSVNVSSWPSPGARSAKSMVLVPCAAARVTDGSVTVPALVRTASRRFSGSRCTRVVVAPDAAAVRLRLSPVTLLVSSRRARSVEVSSSTAVPAQTALSPPGIFVPVIPSPVLG